MNVNFYILVQVEKGEPWKVAAKISEIDGVITSHTVTGLYDIIIFAKGDALDSLKDIVKRIHQVEGVHHTQTAVCIP